MEADIGNLPEDSLYGLAFDGSRHDSEDGLTGGSGEALPVATPSVDADNLLRVAPPPALVLTMVAACGGFSSAGLLTSA